MLHEQFHLLLIGWSLSWIASDFLYSAISNVFGSFTCQLKHPKILLLSTLSWLVGSEDRQRMIQQPPVFPEGNLISAASCIHILKNPNLGRINFQFSEICPYGNEGSVPDPVEVFLQNHNLFPCYRRQSHLHKRWLFIKPSETKLAPPSFLNGRLFPSQWDTNIYSWSLPFQKKWHLIFSYLSIHPVSFKTSPKPITGLQASFLGANGTLRYLKRRERLISPLAFFNVTSSKFHLCQVNFTRYLFEY